MSVITKAKAWVLIYPWLYHRIWSSLLFINYKGEEYFQWRNMAGYILPKGSNLVSPKLERNDIKQLLLWWTEKDITAKAGRSAEVRSSRPTWPTWWNPVSIKNRNNSQAWWCASVIPATQEAGAVRITWTWEAEVAVSWDHAIVLQPRQ